MNREQYAREINSLLDKSGAQLQERLRHTSDEHYSALAKVAGEYEGFKNALKHKLLEVYPYLPDISQPAPAPWMGCPSPYMLERREWQGRDVFSGELYIETAFLGSVWTGVHHYFGHGVLEDIEFWRCLFKGAKKWLSRLYRVRNIKFVDCTFEDVVDEHGVYIGVAGGGDLSKKILFLRCLFRDIGSQALQVVQRAFEQDFDFMAAGDIVRGCPIALEDVHIENCGWNWSGSARASFALSLFSTMNDVSASCLSVDNSMQRYSKGCALFGGRPLVELDDCLFVAGATDRPVVQFESVANAHLSDCHVSAPGGQNTIKFIDCPHVEFQRCTGDARVMRDDVDVGPISSNPSW